MSEKSSKIYHLILFALSLVLLAGLAFYVQKNGTSFIQLKSIKLEYIFALTLLHAASFWLLGMTHKLPLKKHNINLNFKEWYGLCLIAELFNMLLPANGGTGIRMLYIKNKKGLPMREFLSMSFAIVLIGFTFLGLSGIIYCRFFLTKTHPVFLLLESIFIALTVSGVILMFATEAIGKVFKLTRKYTPKIYLKDSKLTGLATLCWIGMFLLYPLKVYYSFIAIGIHLPFFDIIEISLILLAASLFQVLPGNIGVKEIITAYIGKQYGIEFETALLASLIDRAILLLFLVPGGMYFYWELFLETSLPKFRFSKLKQSAQTSP